MTTMMSRWSAGDAMPDAHIHLGTESRDCDGDYLRAHIVRPEGVDVYDLLKALVFEYLPDTEETTLVRTADGSFEWTERTEEGYRAVQIRPCEKGCSDDDRNLTYSRDLSAERAGY
jgi:hypothetical protein